MNTHRCFQIQSRLAAASRYLALLLLVIPFQAASIATAQADPDTRFQRLDKNQDGKLSQEELADLVNPQTFKRMDRNGDDFLTPGEVPRRPAQANQPATTARPPSPTKSNLRYSKVPGGGDPNLLSLDIYAAPGAENLPVMIYIHGGGWRRGDKAAVGSKPTYFNQQGFVFVSINYRFVPAVDILTQLQDSANAVGWVKRNIEQYGGDPSQLHLIGHSAGAHHVAILGTNKHFLNHAGVDLSDLKSVIELDTQALDVVTLMKNNSNDLYQQAFGKDPDVWKQISPLHHVAKDHTIPPFLLVIADSRQQKIIQAKAFQKSLQAAGFHCELLESPEHTHGSLNRDIGEQADRVTRAIKAFHQSLR